MFDKSIFMLKKCAGDAHAFAYYATLITQGFFLIYYILLLSFSYGRPLVNGALLLLSTIAFIFILLTESPQGAKNAKIGRTARIFVRYAKYCVHIVSISLMLYSFYSNPEKAPAFALILLVFATLSFIVQLLAEIVGFLCRRYFEELLAAVLSDTERLRAIIEKTVDGIDAAKGVWDSITSIPDRAAEKAGALAKGIKRGFSFLKKKKSEIPPPMIEGEFTEEGKEETVSSN